MESIRNRLSRHWSSPKESLNSETDKEAGEEKKTWDMQYMRSRLSGLDDSFEPWNNRTAMLLMEGDAAGYAVKRNKLEEKMRCEVFKEIEFVRDSMTRLEEERRKREKEQLVRPQIIDNGRKRLSRT